MRESIEGLIADFICNSSSVRIETCCVLHPLHYHHLSWYNTIKHDFSSSPVLSCIIERLMACGCLSGLQSLFTLVVCELQYYDIVGCVTEWLSASVDGKLKCKGKYGGVEARGGRLYVDVAIRKEYMVEMVRCQTRPTWWLSGWVGFWLREKLHFSANLSPSDVGSFIVDSTCTSLCHSCATVSVFLIFLPTYLL